MPIAQLYNASKTGDEKVVRALLGQGGNANFKDSHGRTPLWWSASNGHVSVATLFLERDDVLVQLNVTDSYGWTPLHEAAANGHEPVVRLLLCRDGVDTGLIDGEGLTALDWAIENEHADSVQISKNHMGLK
jgi:ankyrin repeat protein